MMIGRPCGTPHARASAAVRSGPTARGSNRAGSTPGGTTRSRGGASPWRAAILSAMKRLTAITRSPAPITAL
jgi:hypothetical protein